MGHSVYSMILTDYVAFLLQVEIIGRLCNRHQRDQYLSALLNGSPVVDVQLTEAAKVIVMLVAIDAYENFISGFEVSSPVIIWQTFGRESSHSAERFFHDHVNCVGDTAVLGEDKVRLCFLVKLFSAKFSEAPGMSNYAQKLCIKARLKL